MGARAETLRRREPGARVENQGHARRTEQERSGRHGSLTSDSPDCASSAVAFRHCLPLTDGSLRGFSQTYKKPDRTATPYSLRHGTDPLLADDRSARTSRTTTRSGGGRSATSAACTSACASRASSRGWRGSRSCASARRFGARFAGFDPERVARFGESGRRAAARRRRNRSPPRQDRGGDRQRAGDARAARDRDAARPADVGVPRRRRTARSCRGVSKAAGFRFVGPTTVYSSLEAVRHRQRPRADCWVRRRRRGRAPARSRLALEDLLQPREVLRNCFLACCATSPAAKPGTSPSAVDGEPRSVSRRLELVPAP